jgi:subtilisin family serine protease
VRKAALEQLDNRGFHPIEPPEPFDIRDHGLFVAGVVHATAPWARIRLIRVLNNFGLGSLHSVLVGLVALLLSRRQRDPLVINLSLGAMPALEQLPDTWFGFPIEGLPGSAEDRSLQFLPDGKEVSRDRVHEMAQDASTAVARTLNALEEPVRQLMLALEAQNCVVVAAAGNDSVFRGVDRTSRWSPRVPARYDQVLGVAADTVRPDQAARYSNLGEIVAEPVRDAVATFGGDLAADGVSPSSGVIGVYSAEQFPPRFPPAAPQANLSGWSEWSGTSFSTPIMSGIAANFWATYPGASAHKTLQDLNAAFRFGSPPDVASLGVPPVPVKLTWLP